MPDRRSSHQPAEYLYGRNAVIEALRSGRGVRVVYVADTSHGEVLRDLQHAAEENRVQVRTASRHRLDQMAGDVNHQGVVAEVEPYQYLRAEQLLTVAERRGEAPLLLALDSLQDPQNFGTLIRAAQIVGSHGILIPEHRAVGVTPAVVKASAGAVNHLAVARETNLARSLESLKKAGVWTYGLAVEGAQPFWEVDWTAPSALVVGAEGPGLGRLVRETCDILINIPMSEAAVQSLNAATAGSIVLYEAFRQRAFPARGPGAE